ncbi:MAG: hypothetical protein U5Q44_07955 [Dehalococcoidia bacterium]|nr:hypothetical protein [Dehalococcoidia bacterium]
MTSWIPGLRDRRRDDDESGQGLAEYALLLVLIAIACVGALGALGQAINASDGFKVFDIL